MDADKLKMVGVDYETGLNRFLCKKEVYERLLRKFCINNQMENIRSAFDAKDLEKLFYYMHDMKGTAANLSFLDIEAECRSDMELLTNKNYNALDEGINKMQQMVLRLCRVIKES